MWPWSYNKCGAIQYLDDKQEVNACMNEPGFGLRQHQGRGAPEIGAFRYDTTSFLPFTQVLLVSFYHWNLLFFFRHFRSDAGPRNARNRPGECIHELQSAGRSGHLEDPAPTDQWKRVELQLYVVSDPSLIFCISSMMFSLFDHLNNASITCLH